MEDINSHSQQDINTIRDKEFYLQRDINFQVYSEMASINKKLDNHLVHFSSRMDRLEKAVIIELMLLIILNPYVTPIILKLFSGV